MTIHAHVTPEHRYLSDEVEPVEFILSIDWEPIDYDDDPSAWATGLAQPAWTPNVDDLAGDEVIF